MKKLVAPVDDYLPLEKPSNLAATHCFALSIISGCGQLACVSSAQIIDIQQRHQLHVFAGSECWLHPLDAETLGRDEQLFEPETPAHLTHLGHVLRTLSNSSPTGDPSTGYHNGFFIGNLRREDTNRNHAISLQLNNHGSWKLFDSMSIDKQCGITPDLDLQLHYLSKLDTQFHPPETIQAQLLWAYPSENVTITIRYFCPTTQVFCA